MTSNRPSHRALSHRLGKVGLRLLSRERRPNHVSDAIHALQKAVRARRRLMRLAPRVFDNAVVDRELASRARDETWQAECHQALTKVFDVEPQPARSPCDALAQCWPKSRRTLRAIEREMAAYQLWFHLGQVALRRFQERQPHARLGLNQIARLLNLADSLGRIATGLETTAPKEISGAEGYLDVRTALEKIYGEPERAAPESTTGATEV